MSDLAELHDRRREADFREHLARVRAVRAEMQAGNPLAAAAWARRRHREWIAEAPERAFPETVDHGPPEARRP